uniref:Cytochrome b-c1 complex subunit 6 n=1 Tax=Tetraselmis sp. GSL018 TaxID=582737 RepID=A0A061R170_9CHLO
MSDEDPVCPKPELEEKCKPSCVKALVEYQACVERIEKDTTGEAHCTGQYFDYWSCIDKCAAAPLFAQLK